MKTKCIITSIALLTSSSSYAAEEKDAELSALTSRIVLEKEFEHTPFSLDMELTYELSKYLTDNIGYGSIGLGWKPSENSYISLGVGAGERGIPMKTYTPFFLLEGKTENEIQTQATVAELELEYFPGLQKQTARAEFLFNTPDVKELFLGANLALSESYGIEIGPEIKFPLFSLGEIKMSNSLKMIEKRFIQNGRIVFEKQF